MQVSYKDPGSVPGWEDPLEEGMATHSSILAGEPPRTEEPGRLHSVESHTTEAASMPTFIPASPVKNTPFLFCYFFP